MHRHGHGGQQKSQLHDLILRQATGVLGAFHDIAVAHVGVLDIGKAQRPAAVLVASEFSCRR